MNFETEENNKGKRIVFKEGDTVNIRFFSDDYFKIAYREKSFLDDDVSLETVFCYDIKPCKLILLEKYFYYQ